MSLTFKSRLVALLAIAVTAGVIYSGTRPADPTANSQPTAAARQRAAVESVDVAVDEAQKPAEPAAMSRGQRRKFEHKMEAVTPVELPEKAPASFEVIFSTTKGAMTYAVHSTWSPIGVQRLYDLVKSGFFADSQVGIFRCVKGFVLQFGIHGDPAIQKAWRDKPIKDDPVLESNAKGTLTFATSGKNTRTTQFFWNLGNNKFLDKMGFSPIAECVKGCEVLDAVELKYKEKPNQGQLQNKGRAYLKENFPDLDYITDAQIVLATP